tara:strand:- start:2645 stop:2854 length:210 start_codon:yes stop_codon:yes gene_type:complete
MSTENDCLMVTADDYTVKLDLIDNSMFDEFYCDPNNREKIMMKHQGSAIAAFKEYLIEELPLQMALHKH